MYEFLDVIKLFTEMANNLKRGIINLHSPLEEMVLTASRSDLAYVDNRKDAKEKYRQDFWSDTDKDWLKSQGIEEKLLYSKSEQSPDFLLKVRRQEGKLTCGSLLELKDSKGRSIASFNSTFPTKYKSLEEIDVINGTNLVSRIASIKDGGLAQVENYHARQRRSFYLVRTHRNDDRVKISIVDGSFFETVPKEHLIYQMFLNVLRAHLEKKEIKTTSETLKQIEELLSHITDQTIIATSQIIEGASVRPRLRIMAEVHSEGNPHNASFYPEISGQSLNLIPQASPAERGQMGKFIASQIPEVKAFTICHKRNGEHLVFQLSSKSQ
jgi:hypothetical protein